MPAGRFLQKSISTSRKLAALKTDGARLLFTWLISHVDIMGCFSGDPEIINGKIFTRLKKPSKKVEEYLIDMESVSLIVRYEANGDAFLCIPSFREHQPNLNPDREAKSECPPPPRELLRTNSGANPDDFPTIPLLSKVKISKVNDNVEPLLTRVLDHFNSVTGQKRGSEEAKKLIRGRIAEGRTFENFEHVIDTKTCQWLDDQKMRKYLRPSTLFREGNFEDYLNEPYQDPKKKKAKGDRAGEHTAADEHIPGYWDECRKQKKLGLTGEALSSAMKTWESNQSTGKEKS